MTALLLLILLGLTLGLGATLSPGPLLTLVVTTTLERGFGAGLRVAVAPLITDLPIIVLGLFVLGFLPLRLVGALAIPGGAFAIYLGIETMIQAPRAELAPLGDSVASRRDIGKGVLMNLLSPNPWIFILTVLDPQLVSAWRRVGAAALAFPIAFYVVLVGGKIAIAALVGSLRSRLQRTWYRRTLAAAGVLLSVAGLVLIVEGLRSVLH
ncbi:MAG TPA: LysE family transporter [Candidatus Dormibacteraeota bacterium]|jgi:threonine/homoserine/homoserine lactone efflux protein